MRVSTRVAGPSPGATARASFSTSAWPAAVTRWSKPEPVSRVAPTTTREPPKASR
jgi:hypothetical protein